MVTFCPDAVDSVKPVVDTSLTVPTDPPAAGPDRALAPPLGLPCPAGADEDVAVDEEEVAVVEEDVAAQPATPTTADISAAASIHRPFRFDSGRRAPGRPTCSAGELVRS
jgi:hypothetical protein